MNDKPTNSKINIRFVPIGYFPFDFNISRIEKWKSCLFKVHKHEITNPLRTLHQKDGSTYNDSMLLEDISDISKTITPEEQRSFIFVLTNSPVEEGWYSRILAPNAVVMSFSNVRNYLIKEHIPLENAVISLFYMYSLLYKKDSRIPEREVEEAFLHMDTRACIFDMTPSNADIVYCSAGVGICYECSKKLNILGKDLINKEPIRNFV